MRTPLAQLAGVRILVTGGSGLIGRATVNHLHSLGAEVTVFDLAIRPDVGFAKQIEGDVTDQTAVRAAVHGADAVVHLAGVAGAGIADPAKTYATNTIGTFLVLIESARAGMSKVVFASSINANGYPLNTDAVAPPSFPYDESLVPKIGDWYSLSKLANEDAAKMVNARWGLPVTGLRFPLVRDITSDGGQRFGRHIRDAIRTDPRRQACEGFSYLDVSDAARALVAALTHETPAAPGILVAAPRTYLSNPTPEALQHFLPGVAVQGQLQGRAVGLDLRRADRTLAFRAQVLLEDVAEDQLIDLFTLDQFPLEGANHEQ